MFGIDDVEGCNFHDLVEKELCVGRHGDVEQGKQHDQLLGIDHVPKRLQRCCQEDIHDEVDKDN